MWKNITNIVAAVLIGLTAFYLGSVWLFVLLFVLGAYVVITSAWGRTNAASWFNGIAGVLVAVFALFAVTSLWTFLILAIVILCASIGLPA